MAVNNSLAKNKEEKLSFEYESNGEKVKLSPATVRNYLVSGGGQVTDQEVMMFMTLCKYQHLNPFLREAYLIKFGTAPATLVTGKEVFTKRAKQNPDYNGKKAGIIVVDENGVVTEREGTFKLPNEEIVGGWAKVFIKGYEAPEYVSVTFDEYVGRKKDGTINEQWQKKPATMIRKVALVQALREAFPENYRGMYSPEEIPEIANVVLDDNIIDMEQPPVIEQQAEPAYQEQPQQAIDNIDAALFG